MVSIRYSPVIAAAWLLAFLVMPVHAGPQGRILGTVEDEQGRPIGDVEVVVTGDGFEFDERFSTNKKGRFTATIVDATRDYLIRISKDGYVAVEGPIEVGIGDATRVSWTLKALVEQPPTGVPAAIEAYNRGASAFNQGYLEGAIADFRQAITLDPELTAAYGTLAQVLYQAGNYAEAATTAQRWLEREPTSAEAVTLAFDSLMAADDAAGAAELVDRIAESADPEAAKRIFNAGAVAVSSGNRRAGMELMTRALEVDPRLVQAHSNLARLHAADDELELAEQHARSALELDPQDPGALIALFDVYQRRGDEQAAREFLEVMKSADPQRAADILGEQAGEYLNLGRLEIADELSNEALKLDPGNPKALLARASLALNQNDIELAKECLQAVIDAAPDSAQADQAREMLEFL